MELMKIRILKAGTPIYISDGDSLNSYLLPAGSVVYVWGKHNSPLNQSLYRKGHISLEIYKLKSDIENR